MSTNNSMNRLLSVPAVASRLGISERAVWALIATKELRSVKLKRRRLVDSIDLEKYIDGLKEAS